MVETSNAHNKAPMSEVNGQAPDIVEPFLDTAIGSLLGCAFGYMVGVVKNIDRIIMASFGAFAFGAAAGYNAHRNYYIKKLAFLDQNHQKSRIKTIIVEIMEKTFKPSSTETPPTGAKEELLSAIKKAIVEAPTVSAELKERWLAIKQAVEKFTKELTEYSQGGKIDVTLLSPARKEFKENYIIDMNEFFVKIITSECLNKAAGCKNLTENEKKMIAYKIQLIYQLEYNQSMKTDNILESFPKENRNELKTWADKNQGKKLTTILQEMQGADSKQSLFKKDDIEEIKLMSTTYIIFIKAPILLDSLEEYNVVLSEDPAEIIEFK